MKKKFLLLWLFSTCFACSTDSPNEELPEAAKSFDVTLTPSVNQVYIDVPFNLKVQSDVGIYDITRIFPNGVQSVTAALPGTALDAQKLNMHLQFASLGNQDVVLEFSSISGKKVTKTLNFYVKRGNVVKIVGFKINSFHNMNGRWDDEFSDTDPNRLADIQFALRKLFLNHFTIPVPNMNSWYLSPVYPNMQQLEWNLSQEGLYISNTSTLQLGIADDDGNGTSQDLARDFPGLIIKFNDYRQTKPAVISLKNEEDGFDVTFQLEWL